MRTWRGLDRTVGEARASAGAEREELLHEVRKEAKRSRYAAEAVVPAFGAPAQRYARAVKKAQTSLGELQDGVAARQVLVELAGRGDLDDATRFTLGRLHGLEQARADAAAARWPQVRARAADRRLRRWLRGS